jgi:E1A/CREB-binding protein
MKEELKKKKNDEVHEESWVQCDDCECWIHQICGLFNSRQNKEHHSKYFCPKCLLKKKKRGEMTNVPAPPSAAELPRTKLSEQLESHVQAKVEEKIKQLAMEKARMEVRYFGRGLLPLYTVLSIVMLTLFRFVTEHYSVGGEKVA